MHLRRGEHNHVSIHACAETPSDGKITQVLWWLAHSISPVDTLQSVSVMGYNLVVKILCPSCVDIDECSVLYHTSQYSNLTPGSLLRDKSWWDWRTISSAGDPSQASCWQASIFLLHSLTGLYCLLVVEENPLTVPTLAGLVQMPKWCTSWDESSHGIIPMTLKQKASEVRVRTPPWRTQSFFSYGGMSSPAVSCLCFSSMVLFKTLPLT